VVRATKYSRHRPHFAVGSGRHAFFPTRLVPLLMGAPTEAPARDPRI
jgi:hypothetical protein